MKQQIFDVLVVGGGGAGVMAAVQAARSGANVGLVSKGRIGRSGNYIMMGGTFGIDGPSAKNVCGAEDANQEYTAEILFEKLVANSFEIGDQRLQKHFVDVGPLAVREVLSWAEASKQKFTFLPAACRWRTSGRAFGNALRHGLETESNVEVIENVMVTGLLKSERAVTGAVGFDVYSGEILAFQAKAVIIATGGYQPMVLKNTTSDMCGNGIGLALRAGARVRDLEFLLHIPTIIEPQPIRGSIIPFQMTMPGLFPLRQNALDLDGKEIHYPNDSKYIPDAAGSKINKLLLCYFYGTQMFEKWKHHGNQLYFDYSHYSDQEIRDAFDFFAQKQATWYPQDMYHQIKLSELADHIINNDKRLLVGFGNEYSMGGIVINDDFESDVAGLFAAGEVTGGLFGAFRSGDGITEMLAHGYTAGHNAAEYAKTKVLQNPDNLEVEIDRIKAPMQREGEPYSARKYLQALENACELGFNFIRSEKLLKQTMGEIELIKSKLPELRVKGPQKYNLDLVDYFNLCDLLLCTEIGVYSAINRKESRGCHIHMDYPEVDNANYRFSFSAELEAGTLHYAKIYPDAVFQPLDSANHENIAECIATSIIGGKHESNH